MRTHAFGSETRSITNAFNDTSHKRGAIQLAHLLWDTDEGVDQWLIVYNHVLVALCVALLQGISSAIEECPPQYAVNELQQVQYPCGPGSGTWRLAVKEQIEELRAYGVASTVEPGFNFGD